MLLSHGTSGKLFNVSRKSFVKLKFIITWQRA